MLTILFFSWCIAMASLLCQIWEDFMKQNTQRSQGFIDFKYQTKLKKNVVEVRRKWHNCLDCWIQITSLPAWPSQSHGIIFGLAEVELTFKHLCFVFVATTVETTPVLGSWVSSAQVASGLSLQHFPQRPAGLECARGGEGRHCLDNWSKLTKGTFHPIWCCKNKS